MQTGSTFFNLILEEVLYIEKTRRSICQELLLVKDNKVRRKLVYNYLSCTLDKHEVLEQAAVIAIEGDEEVVLKQLELFYKHCEGKDILAKIQGEAMRTELYLDIIDKAVEYPKSISFAERRLIKEIIKYVTAQARYYNRCKSTDH